jgi:hypothetical protein
MRQELQLLNDKVELQSSMIENLAQSGVKISENTTAPQPATVQPVLEAGSPEQDPQWPPFITCYADLAKRDEIKAKYEFIAKYGK